MTIISLIIWQAVGYQMSEKVEPTEFTLSKEHINNERFFDGLHQLIGALPQKDHDMFSSTPVLVNENMVTESVRLCGVLNRALMALVGNYFNDKRIRDVFELDAQLESILKIAESSPYSVGMFRPDFVYDKTGQAKICEIGCRYPINGWMFSYYINQLVEKLRSELPASWESVPNQLRFISKLTDTFEGERTVFWVHENEPGTEIKYLIDEWKKEDINVVSVNPSELQLNNNQVCAKGYTSSRFILELDREELRLIRPKVMQVMVESGACINDVRSLILVHDKRVLTALFDEDIMHDYISAQDCEFLKSFLIPSFTLNHQQKRAALMNTSENWILKRNSGGRGVGMLVKNDCSSEKWRQTITDDYSNYMVQKYVDQKVFKLKGKAKELKLSIVGMLLCFNNESFGFGIFRGSSESIINVHEGRGIIFPCIVQSRETS